METQVINATEYRNVPLSLLNPSRTNPRRTFEDAALKELAESIRAQGVLSPLLVRPLTENGFEIVFGERRYRAAQIAGQDTVPVRIRQMSDAEALEAQLVENLIRAEIHPMEEAQGFRALLALEEPKYSIEQVAAKVGKSPAFVASRLKLTDLVPEAVEAFYADEIGVGHALLLAKLPPDAQQQALPACFKEVYSGNSQKPARILLPVRNLQFWIDANILLVLKDAPFNKRDPQLVPTAGSCAECPKRTGHNKLLFGDDLGKQGDRCTDPTCHVTTLKTVWTKVRANAGVKGRWHDNRHTLITELAESGAGDQTIMDIAGHVSKQMLKHYSHIRMEAKRSALEAIVRKSSAPNESQQGYPQKSPQSPQNGGKTLNNGHAPEPMELAIAPKNGARDCSESLGFAQDFEGEYPQKSPQSGIFEGRRGVGSGRKSLKRLAPQVGLEPTTLRLTAECSAIELLRSAGWRTGTLYQRSPGLAIQDQ